MSEIPLETLKVLYREFCLARFDYPDDRASEEHIDNDARSYWYSHVHGDEKTPLSLLVDAVWAAGRESASTRDDYWRDLVFSYYHAPDGSEECADAWYEMKAAVEHWRAVEARKAVADAS